MEVRELSVPGAWELTPRQWPDQRGVFLEWFKADVLEQAIGHPFVLRQVNHSVSARGTLRGIHFADVPPSQAKYVFVTHGAALDFVVDIRIGSPTFGALDALVLDDVDRRAVYVSEGLGHAVLALTDDVALSYLVTQPYAPEREHGIDPFDPEIGLREHPLFPAGLEPLVSDRDAVAPSLEQARQQGLLPSYEQCLALYERLRQ